MENKERLSAVQFTSVAQSCPTLCDPMYCSTLGFPVLHCLQSLLKLMPIESMMLSNHLILSCPLLLLPSIFPSIQFSSVAQSCPTLCDPMDCSTSDFPVHHQLSELTQTHDHQVSDAIQPSHPLSFPSPAFSLSQHQDLS